MVQVVNSATHATPVPVTRSIKRMELARQNVSIKSLKQHGNDITVEKINKPYFLFH
jgi:hypothetical protein